MVEEIKFYSSVGEYGFLSNLYRSPVFYEGILFPSAEHAYQFGKAKDWEIKKYILMAPSPVAACIVGHGLFPWMVTPGWKEFRRERMAKVLGAKFEQNEDLKTKLLATGKAILIEDSKSDGYWGIGRNGKGKNMLGKLLMHLRGVLQEESR